MTRCDNQRRPFVRAAAVLLSTWLAWPSAGQHELADAPIAIDPALGWDMLIEATLTAHPASAQLVARRDEADAWQRRGRHWLAAAPSLYFSYLSDGPADDQGQREYDSGIELPLWRPGQRGAVQAVAASAGAASAAAAAALRLEVAGLLRGALWDIASAEHALAAARDGVGVAEELRRVVERRRAGGDLAEADVLLAQVALLERRQAEVDAEATLHDAERSYRSLTGLGRRPADFAEQSTDADELSQNHPLLALAAADLARARADRGFVERDTRQPVTVTVGPHREYDPFGTLPRDSLTLAVKVPVGGKTFGGTQAAQAGRVVAEAESAKAQLERRLELDLHEAEHTLSVIAQSATLAAERASTAERQLTMAESAFAQGEIELRELLRVQETTLIARRDLERLEIERGRTIAALNQALGETP